jgi:hypothetical protein
MAAACARSDPRSYSFHSKEEVTIMRSILLYMLGVPIPIIILIALFWH